MKKAQRAVLFEMFGGKCAYCGCDLPERGWHADHVEPIKRDWWKSTGLVGHPERDIIANLLPACQPCNLDKSCYPLEDWRLVIEQKVRVLRDNSTAYRHAERFGLVKQVEQKVVFHFERVGAR